MQSDGVTFDGMIGMLQRMEGDICIGGLDIKETRARVIDYTSGIFSDQCKIFIRSDQRLRLNFYEIFFVFRHQVWICMAAVILLGSFAIFMYFTFEPIRGSAGLLNNLANALAIPCRAIILKGRPLTLHVEELRYSYS